MQEALGLIRGLSLTTANALYRSRLAGFTVKKEFEERILDVLKRAQNPSSHEDNPPNPESKESLSRDNKFREEQSSNIEAENVQNAGSETNATSTVRFEPPDIKNEKTPVVNPPTRSLGATSRERKVPSTQIGRVLGFAGLGANLAYGAVQDGLTSFFRSDNASSSKHMMNERNAEVLAAGLCRMRGAALKLGQMLSIQDETVIPPYLQTALDRVRAGADYMPRHQLERVLRTELGADWIKKFREFDFIPMAAASIGQVHRAILPDGTPVALKIQYPGVANSIESDLNNLMTLMKMTDVLPKGLYVDTMVRVMRKELALECDYEYELKSQQTFKKFIDDDEYCRTCFRVPNVFPEYSTKQILTSEWVPGVPVDKVKDMSQEIRNDVGKRLLDITMKELFIWRYMQTDPNWGNFLYDSDTQILSLIDFGAAKAFPKEFTDAYLLMVAACAEQNRERVIEFSKTLGFLTGDENEAMLNAHCEAGFIVGKAFSGPGEYDFAQHSKLTARVTELGGVMLKNRLCPPPEESYSLHRRLSGAFLCCIKLRAVVPSHAMFYEILRRLA